MSEEEIRRWFEDLENDVERMLFLIENRNKREMPFLHITKDGCYLGWEAYAKGWYTRTKDDFDNLKCNTAKEVLELVSMVSTAQIKYVIGHRD